MTRNRDNKNYFSYLALAAYLTYCLLIPSTVTADDTPLVNKFTRSVNRIGFVPGDAFFPLQIEDIFSFDATVSNFASSLDSEESQPDGLLFDYQYPPTVAPEFYGFGFSRVRVSNVTSEDCNILSSFGLLTSFEQEEIDYDEGKRWGWGIPSKRPMLAFVIVNKDFDFEKFKPFVRYNQDWNEEQPGFWPGDRSLIEGKPAPVDDLANRLWPQRYQPHVMTAEAVLEDWVNGPKVAPLKVRLPKKITREKDGEHKIIEPVEIDFRDVAFVAFPTDDLELIYQQRLNSTFYVATTEGLHRYRWIMSTGDEIGKRLVKELIEEPERE